MATLLVMAGSLAHANSGSTRADAEMLTDEQEFSMAAEALSVGNVTEAVERLRVGASAGHVPSLEMIGVILLHGPALFGPTAPLDACEATRWFGFARRLGSVVAARYYPLLVRLQRGGTVAGCQNGE